MMGREFSELEVLSIFKSYWDIGQSTGLYCAEYSQIKDVGNQILELLTILMSILERLEAVRNEYFEDIGEIGDIHKDIGDIHEDIGYIGDIEI